jgi:O-antigen/teichoic acid export membrane protein
MIQTDLPFEPLLCFAFVAGALTQCLFSIQKTFFLVVDKYKTVALISFFYNSSVFVIPVVFCIWQEIPPPFEDILVYLLIVRASIILIGALGLPKLATRNINNYTRLSLWQIFDYGKWIGLSQLCQTVLENLDKFFVTYFFGSSALAVYNIAVSVSQKVTVLPVSFSTAIFAKMAKVGEKGTETELLRVLWYLWICLIVFLLGAKQFFTIWLGEHYTQEIGRISVLSFVAYSFFGLNAVFNSLLEIGQKAKKLAFFDSITLVIALTVYFFVNEQFSPLEIATVFLYQQWAAHLVRIKMLSISKTLKFYLRFSAIVFLVIGTALAYN